MLELVFAITLVIGAEAPPLLPPEPPKALARANVRPERHEDVPPLMQFPWLVTPAVTSACSNAVICSRVACKPGEYARKATVTRDPFYRACIAECVERRADGTEVVHIQVIYCYSMMRA